MRFFIPNQMVAALRENAVGRREFYCYAVLEILAVIGLFFSDSNEFASMQTYYTYLLIATFGITLSVVVAYRANNTGDGKQFWYRYFSLSWPVSWLTFVVGFPVVLIGLFAIAFVTDTWEVSHLYSGVHNVFSGTVLLLCSYFMHVYMRKVSRVENKK
jgi:hypothetical protein